MPARRFPKTVVAVGAVLVLMAGGLVPAPASAQGPASDSVGEAMQIGRYWHASRLLRDSGGSLGGAEERLLLARSLAGWAAWSGVRDVLEGASWLADVGDGEGLFLLARAHEDAEEWTAAARAYASFRSVSPDSMRVALAGVRRVRALARTSAMAEALRDLEELGGLSSFARSWLGLELARAQADSGDLTGVQRALAVVSDPQARGRGLLLPAQAAVHAGDSGLAVSLLEAVITTGDADADPGADLAGAWSLLGRLRLDGGDTAEARTALLASLAARTGGEAATEAALALVSTGPLRRDTLLLVANVLRRGGEILAALAAYDRHVGEAPAGDPPPEATRLARARLLVGERRNREAAVELEALGGSDDPAIGGPALRMLYRLRRRQIHLMRGEQIDAAQVFEDYLSDFPDGRRWEEASYWAARTHLELGDTARADELLDRLERDNPLSYYAVLAAELEGVPYAPSLPVGTLGPRPAWVEGGMEQLGFLVEAGLHDAARALVARLSARADGDAHLHVARGLNEAGFPIQGITLAREMRENGQPWTAALARTVYPFLLRDLVVAEAEERGLDVYLVAGLIRQESAFWATARSPAGALGLMQIMPPTGRDLGRRLGLGPVTRSMLHTPELNLHLGTLFLRDQLARNDGDLSYFLAAYNAGPARVRRWRGLPEASNSLRFVERIPFAETRDYVKRVVRNVALYRWLYGDPDVRGNE